MKSPEKNQSQILAKLGIAALNAMQEEAMLAIQYRPDNVLLSPTGTGKTLAFLLPLIAELDIERHAVQLLILVPSRELAIQIEQVVREMGTGFKANAVYGGRPFAKDKQDLKHIPAILIGTPGRVADHLRRKTFSTRYLSMLVLDEFDKSLEVGFEDDMKEIIAALPRLTKRVLTSATQGVDIPDFVGLKDPGYIDFLDADRPQITIERIVSPSKDKLDTLAKALCHLGNQPGLVFCNFKDSIQRVSDYLTEQGIPHGTFYGGMEQTERERALIKFRNGTHQLLITTDLAARGIDVPEIKFIIHYHLPHRSEEFTHRNGRTARMHKDGTAYILHWTDEPLPDFIPADLPETILAADAPPPATTGWKTLFVSGGRRDKISKGDIAGLFCKQGQLRNDQLGTIELKQDCAFVAVHADKVNQLLTMVDGTKLKEKKIRVTVV